MWHPMATHPTDTNKRVYSDKEMAQFLSNAIDNGWTAKKNEDGTVSAFKDGNHIRNYAYAPDFDHYDPFDGTDDEHMSPVPQWGPKF